MKNLLKIFTAVCALLIVVASCKDKDNDPIVVSEKEEPAISIKVPGLTITDNVLHVSVAKDSTMTIDYTVTASAMIQQFIQSVDGNEEIIQEATGLEEFTGAVAVNIPYEDRIVTLNFTIKDEQGKMVSGELSIDIARIELVYGGEQHGIRWEADKLSEGGILKLFDAESRFETKANPLPMYFFDFSSGSTAPHPTYSRKDGNNIVEAIGEPSTEQIPPQKTQSWKAPLKDVRYASSVVKIKDSDFAEGISIVVRRFWTHDGNTEGHDKYGRFNHKLCRLWSGGGINPYYQYDRLLMEQSPVNSAKYWDGAKHHTAFVRTWVLDEVRYVPSSELDVADASVQLRRNGVLVSELLNTISRTTEKPQEWDELAIDQVVNLGEVPEGFAVYYDMLAVDDSEQRIMLTNNPDLSLATEKEYLPAKVWIDGEIQVYLRQGTFESIHGKYVCIQDEDGNQIGEGIQLQ